MCTNTSYQSSLQALSVHPKLFKYIQLELNNSYATFLGEQSVLCLIKCKWRLFYHLISKLIVAVLCGVLC